MIRSFSISILLMFSFSGTAYSVESQKMIKLFIQPNPMSCFSWEQTCLAHCNRGSEEDRASCRLDCIIERQRCEQGGQP